MPHILHTHTHIHTHTHTHKTFYSTPKLSDFFTVLSTNKDRKGVEFVSSMEGTNKN